MSDSKNEQDQDVKYWWIFPYRWNSKKIFKDLWNEKEVRVFPPKQFGVGWSINFYALTKKLKESVRKK